MARRRRERPLVDATTSLRRAIADVHAAVAAAASAGAAAAGLVLTRGPTRGWEQARRCGRLHEARPAEAEEVVVALTMFGGPLSRRVPETRTFTVEGPAHSLLLEPFTRRVRAEVDGVTVLDTTRGALLFETGLPPQLYVPEEDFRADLLEPSDTTTHCPFKGDATYHSLRVGDRVVTDAVWSYPDPKPEASWLAGRAVLAPAAADRWFDEDDEVIGHLPDPYHRVDLRHTSRHVTVATTDGVPVADASGGVLLGETGLVDRLYIAREAVSATLEPSDTRTVCPYKGVATYFSVRLPEGRVLADAAWSYESPTDESRAIEGLVCFAHDDLVVRSEVVRAATAGVTTS